MIIKILYIFLIVIVIRLVVNSLKKYNQLQDEAMAEKMRKESNKDAINAEYKVVNDNKDT